MQRRVEQTHRHRQPVHRLEQLDEVALLQRQQGGQGQLAILVVVRQDQVLDLLAALLAEEHVLGAAQPDALAAVAAGAVRVVGVVRVGAHREPAAHVRVRHQPVHGLHQAALDVGAGVQGALEVLDHRRGQYGYLAEVDLAAGPVDGDHLALLDHPAVGGGQPAPLGVDLQLLGAADAGLAHAAGDHGRVRGLAAARGEDALGGDHAVQVVRVGLAADQDHLLARAGPLDGGVGVEDHLADRRARGGGDAPGDLLGAGVGGEAREHQLRELTARHPLERLVQVDQALVDQLDGDPEGGCGGALADPGLQHPELAALDGELDVAQVAVVQFEGVHDRHELVVRLLVQPLQVGQLEGVADARDHVLALGVGEVVAVDADRAGGGVAGEGDAGAGVLAEVAEDHRADVDRGAQVVRDPLLAAVEPGPVAVPGVEDGVDRQVHLLARVLREGAAGLAQHDRLEGVDQRLEVARVQRQVVGGALGVLGLLQRLLEELAVHAQHGLAEHLHQAAVGVPGEALVAGLGGQSEDRGVREADVQHGVHHAGHRELGAGADRDQQRVVRLAELLAHLPLQGGQVLADLRVQGGRLAAGLQVDLAGLRGEGEPRRDGESQVGHLGQVRTLAPEKILEVLVSFSEGVNKLLRRRHGRSPRTGLP